MIKVNGQVVKFDTFPNGETKLIEDTIKVELNNTVTFKYENDGELIRLMFVKKYLDKLTGGFSELLITYMPYSRMDRSENGSAFTLKYVSEFVNGLRFSKVTIAEPHSDVTPALVDMVESYNITSDLFQKVKGEIRFDKENDYLFFPDQGAAKRYGTLKGYKHLSGYKNRDFQTGEIKSLEVVGEVEKDNSNRKVLIWDDLSSYGGTFLYSGLKLKELGFNEIYLMVGHCENAIYDGKLLKEDSPITKIFTTDSIINEREGNPKLEVFKLNEFIRGY